MDTSTKNKVTNTITKINKKIELKTLYILAIASSFFGMISSGVLSFLMRYNVQLPEIARNIIDNFAACHAMLCSVLGLMLVFKITFTNEPIFFKKEDKEATQQN